MQREVADEVRSLAMVSAQASKDTTALIYTTLVAIKNGTKIASVVQTNSATAQQSAAASEELNSQSQI